MRNVLVALCLLFPLAILPRCVTSTNVITEIEEAVVDIFEGEKQPEIDTRIVAAVEVKNQTFLLPDHVDSGLNSKVYCSYVDGGGGNARYFLMTLAGCDSSGNYCNLKIGRNYSLTVLFQPRETEYALSLNITAISQPPLSRSSQQLALLNLQPAPFYTSYTYNVTYGVVFPTSWFAKRAGNYGLEIRLFNPQSHYNVGCQTFNPVKLVRLQTNSATSVGFSLFTFFVLQLAVFLNRELF